MSDIAGEDIPRRWTTSRVEAFSDGVFAIAITLLVLDIKVDASDFDHLARALLDQWPAYLSYVTSFLTVGSVWIAHHNLFTRLKYVDAALLRLNMLLLMAAAFLLVAGVRHVGSHPDLLVEPSEAEALPTRRRHERRGWFRTLAYPAAIAFGIVAFPKVAAVGYLVVAAEGVLLLGGRPRFSLRKLLSRA